MLKRLLRLLVVGVSWSVLYGQADSLNLSSGNVTSGSVTLTLSLSSSTGNEPAGLEWVLSYPSGNVVSVSVATGASLTAAGKTLTCYQDPVAGTFTCVAAGMNSSVILNGTVASVTFNMATNATTTAVSVSPTGADPAGGALNMTGTGGTITGSGGSGGASSSPTVSGIACSPRTVAAGSNTSCTVTLTAPAPTGGLPVTLTSQASTGNPVSLPSSLAIPTAALSGTFTVTALAVSSSESVTIKATNNGVGVGTEITVVPGASPSFSILCTPASVTAGYPSTCTVTLASAAPSGGAVVTLASSAAAAKLPGSLAIPVGASSGTFTVSTSTVTSSVTATITATYGGSSVTASVTVQPLMVSSLACSPATVAATDPIACTITLAGPAPPGGVSVAVSDNSSATSEAASVTVPAGASSASFTVSTTAVTTNQVGTIAATLGGATQTSTVNVVPAVPISRVSCTLPTASGTQVMANSATAACTVTLSAAANATQTISLVSSSAALTVPASISIPSRASSASFTAKSGTLSSNSQATSITAKGYGSSAALHFTLSVLVSSLTCSPSAIATPNATGASTCSVLLSQSVPMALAVGIANSSNTSLSAPSSVSIPAATASTTFTAAALQVPFIHVTLAASFSGIAQSAVINVGWPLPSLNCAPAVLTALGTAVCTVTMSGPIPDGGTETVHLRSSSRRLSVPRTVTLPAGATSANFTITALAGFSGPETISATSTGGTTGFTISSAARSTPGGGGLPSSGPISSLLCSPRSIQAGSASLCQLQLGGPSSQARDTLLSVSSGSIQTPAMVTTRPNQSTLSFQAIADRAASSEVVSIQAISNGEAVEERISVTASAEPVLTVPERQAVKLGSKLSFDLSASSAAGPTVLSAGSLPEGASFDPARGRFEWIPRDFQKGQWNVAFSAVDPSGASASAHLLIEAGSGAPLLRSVVHAAAGSAQAAACAPGSLASAEGEWFSDGVASAPDGQALVLAGARVTVNGQYAHLVYSSPQRIVFLCPAASLDALSVSVETEAGHSVSVQVRASDSAPGIFTVDGSGQGQAAAVIFGGSLAMARNYRFGSQPAQPGDSLELSLTGLSPNVGPDRLMVNIGGVETPVDSVHPVPGSAGAVQVAVIVPAAAATGDAVPIAIREFLPDGRIVSSQTATIAIEPVRQ